MSIPNDYVHCHGCDFKGVIIRRPITLEYVLPCRTVVQGYRVSAWCSTCDNITDAEDAFDAASIQSEIDSLRRKQAGFFGRLFGGGKAEDVELKSLQGRLQLSQLRQSGPRCLRCGETIVEPLFFDKSGTSSVVHTCGRRLFIAPKDLDDDIRFIFAPAVIRLDPEGLKI